MNESKENDLLAADILAYVAAGDGRDYGRVDVVMWRRTLPEWLTLDMAMEAVDDYRITSPGGRRIEPGHIRAYWDAIRHKLLRDAGDPPIPGDLTREQEQTWRVVWCRYVKDGYSREIAARRASADLSVPEDGPLLTAAQAGVPLPPLLSILPGVPHTGAAAGPIILAGSPEHRADEETAR